MISDAEIADHVLALYEYAGGPQVTWDYKQPRQADDGISFALKRLNGFDLIVLEGTSSIRDLWRDLVALNNPFTHSKLGPIHFGFWDGMVEAHSIIKSKITQPVIITGHSMGAAHAAILTGLMVLDGVAPVRRVGFGEPRAGTPTLRGLIKDVPTTVYHNRYDLITDLPAALPLVPYCDSAPRAEVHVNPHGMMLLWGPFAWHHMQLYREAL